MPSPWSVQKENTTGTDNIVVWTGIQCRRAIVRATIDEANCPLMQSVDHASLRLCPVLLRCHTENTAVHVLSLCVHDADYLVREG